MLHASFFECCFPDEFGLVGARFQNVSFLWKLNFYHELFEENTLIHSRKGILRECFHTTKIGQN